MKNSNYLAQVKKSNSFLTDSFNSKPGKKSRIIEEPVIKKASGTFKYAVKIMGPILSVSVQNGVNFSRINEVWEKQGLMSEV